MVDLFDAIADALLVIIGWVLWIAPLGVFALGFSVGAAAGGAAFTGLGHYIVLISGVGILVWALAYPVAIIGGRVGLGAFVRGMIAPQAVAISTRSSLASLPAMLTASQAIGIRPQVADVTLPIAVALFRATGPAMNVAGRGVRRALARASPDPRPDPCCDGGRRRHELWRGQPSRVKSATSARSHPSRSRSACRSRRSALLVAVEMIPDIFRTVGNVNWDVALAAVVNRATSDDRR